MNDSNSKPISFNSKYIKLALGVPYVDQLTGNSRTSNAITQTISKYLSPEQIATAKGITLKKSFVMLSGRKFQINSISVTPIGESGMYKVRYLLSEHLEEDPDFANIPAEVAVQNGTTPF